jgi:signal transduction histidine kinase
MNEQVHVKPLVYEIIDQWTHMKEAAEVEIRVQLQEDTVIYTDKIRLKSVLSNLIGNAIKYQDKSKPERFVKISLTKFADVFSILVEDNGQGIHAKFHEKIFDMFFRASENSKGSGLGLFIVKETIDKMNGTVSVQSEYGKGSCFTVTLPLLI